MKKTAINTLKFAALGLTASLLTSSPAFSFDYPEAGDFARGSKLWAENCSRCHNIRSANELRDDQWLTTSFHMRVRAGLSGQETRDILTFLQASNVPAASAPDGGSAAPSGMSGREIYQQTCVACHGADGKGMFPGVPDFTRAGGRLSKSDEELLDNVRGGFQSPGSPMAMPPRGGNASLSDADLKAVIRYLREQFGS
ncbi:MAG TPA: c-type cytochrome [Gammaproteobacteria bacterium]|nr:c-type cytochrome [Gammaproteobacteria bacterium]